MNRLIQHILFILISSILLSAQPIKKEFTLNIGENYRLYPSNLNQWEVSIVNHPYNQDLLFASANVVNLNDFFVSEGIYVTTNGGNSWRGNDTCTGNPIDFHGGDPGIVIDKNGTFILTRKGFSSGIFSHYSTDNGITWSAQKIISNDDTAPERAGLVSDANTSSNFFGRTYAVWVKLAPPFPVVFVYSDDGAQNWTAPTQINNPTSRSAGGEIAMGSDGELYVCWAGVTSTSPFTEDFVGFAASTNGSSNWVVDENAFDMNGISGILVSKGNIRVNGLPRIAVDTTSGPRGGWIYIVTGQKNLSPAGSDEDIILNRSTDNGLTWSQGIRVNQDALNNGRIQLFPAIHVDKYGGVNIIFYDDRNTTSDSLGIFLARSDDGGNTWREFEISDHNFKPTPIAGFQGKMGDNISITSANEKLWPVWMDNSVGRYQIWTVPIDISTVDVKEEHPAKSHFQLEQNYPNPFNPYTSIQYAAGTRQFVSIKIYNVLGNEVATLVNEEKPAGEYKVEFNGSDLPSGLYFYRLEAGNYTETKKMVLIK